MRRTEALPGVRMAAIPTQPGRLRRDASRSRFGESGFAI